jgi:plastocyanin
VRRHCLAIAIAACVASLAAIPVSTAAAGACGPSWSVARSWTHDDSFLFQASSDAGGDAMVAGYRYIINTAYKPIVLQWNGAAWQSTVVPGHGNDTILSGVAVNSPTSAVAVGWWASTSSAPPRTFAVVWNGSSWSISQPWTGRNGTAFLATQLTHAASTSASNVWAVGFFDNASRQEIPIVEHFSGGGWSLARDRAVGIGGQLNDVATDSTTDVWAVGTQSPNLSSGTPLVEHYNGTSWQDTATPSVGTFSELDGVGIASANDVWAVGRSSTGSTFEPIAMHWDGTKWSLVPVPNPSTNGAALVSLKVLGSHDIWAVGSQRTDAFGHNGPLIEHWDGTAWSIVDSAPDSPPAGDEGVLTGTAYSDGHVLATGFNEPQNTSAGITSAQELCPVQVTDAGYSPPTLRVPFGTDVPWSVLASDTAGHSITEGDAGLFNSGVLAPGGSFNFLFGAAGSYTISDTASSHTGKIVVPMTVTPASGGELTTFTLQWALGAPPAGHVYDIQIERPGDTAFSNWMVGQTTTGSTFTPDGGAGTYSFRMRVRRVSPRGQTGFSPPVTITVS